MRFLSVILVILLLSSFIFAVTDLMSLQANVYQNGVALNSGNVSVYIYDAASGGNQIWHQNYSGAIVNGTYDVLLGSNDTNLLSLNYGVIYYLDLDINGINQNFSGNDRQQFQSSVGNITSAKILNNSVSLDTFNITTGVFNVTRGGTNFSSYAAGDLLVGNTTNGLNKLAIGANRVLISNGSQNVTWGLVNSTHIAPGNITSSLIAPDLSLGWANLTSYPSACSAGQFVSAINDTITCEAPAGSVNGSYDASNITTGTLAVARGGTNIGSYSTGDIIYIDGSGSFTKLSITGSRVLVSNGTSVVWSMVNTTHLLDGNVTVLKGGTGLSALTAYAPLFGGTSTTGPVQQTTVGSAGQVLTSNGASTIPTMQFTGSPFGDGVDGDVTIGGQGIINLTRNMNYRNLTVNGILNTSGFTVYVQGVLTIGSGGVIHNNGSNGAPGSGGTSGAGASGTNRTVFMAGSAPGGSGGSASGSGSSNGAAGTAGSAILSSLAVNFAPYTLAAGSGGSGGGGCGSTGNAGSPGGNSTGGASGGAGGAGSCSSNGPFAGGGGGSGGGVVLIYSAVFSNSGKVLATGGKGGDGANSGSGSAGGGGGGGGGGAVVIFYRQLSALGTITVTGGTGGLGVGGGANNGATGSSGSTFITQT